MNRIGLTPHSELGSWSITAHANSFASSYKTLYKTHFTTIAAKAFHIPNRVTGEIHHFDLSIRIFRRKKKANPWIEEKIDSDNSFGNHRQVDLHAGNGRAVRGLTEFLLAQYEMIGTRIESSKIVIDNPKDVDIEAMVQKMNSNQVESFGQHIRLQTLIEYKQFLEANLDKNEMFIQNWLDEDGGKYRKQRCLIFGLEFIDHKREGELSRKRFDILTRTSTVKNEYVIIELKSPSDNVFEISQRQNANDGTSTEYHLSPQVARAIPQILHYKSLLEGKSAGDDDLQRIGIEPGKVSKCIILIGSRNIDALWEDHFKSLKTNFSNSLEIWTYSDLIEKLDVTIQNLNENL